MSGKFILIPTPLGELNTATLPQYVVAHIHQLDTFIAERAKTARHVIKATQPPRAISELNIMEMQEAAPVVDFTVVKAILESGKNIGIMSEAGCPCVADPGSDIVTWAYANNFEVMPLVGPSSIMLALMASGMNGQSFAFQGYLSAKREEIGRDLKKMEDTARRLHQTQIFIETPYRNKQVIEAALSTLSSATRFCIAADLTTPTEFIQTHTIAAWKQKKIPDLHKKPAIFLLGVSAP